jgi:Lrp/AsnC family transcriptional regulator for asnA, asnC and gidA
MHGLAKARLDASDQQIVRCLQEDGRMSIADIARAVGLSHAAVRHRMRRLFDERIVAVGLVTDPGTHGYDRRSTLLVRTGPDPRAVSEEIARIDQVYYVVLATGRVDILVELMARNDRDYEEVIARIRRIPGVVDTESIPFLDLVKWEYRPVFDAGVTERPAPMPDLETLGQP